MTFELKKFTDNDKAAYDAYDFENHLRTFAYPRNWAIDADRQAVFIAFGGRGDQDDDSGEPPNFYALAWKGKKIGMSARVSSHTPPGGVFTKRYDIAFHVLDVMDEEMDELLQLVHQGLHAYEVGLHDLPAARIELLLGTRSYW